MDSVLFWERRQLTPPASQAELRVALTPDADRQVVSLDVFESLDSPHAWLLDKPPVERGRAAVCVAKTQTAGRGRRGRQWLSPPDAGIYLSFGWSFPELRQDLPTLALVVGVTVKQTLERLGATAIQLKWPNDLIVHGGKLGGILIELRSAPHCVYVVIGIGINLRNPLNFDTTIHTMGGQPPRDLIAAGIDSPELTRTTAALISALCTTLPIFERSGLMPFREEWSQADSLRDRHIQWQENDDLRSGIARGLADDGALLVDCHGVLVRLVAGEVTVRVTA